MRSRPARPARFLKTQQLLVAIVPALVVALSITGFVWAQKSVTVIVDGDTRCLTTQATDVGGALRDASVVVQPQDVVTPPRDSHLSDGLTIVVRHSVPVTFRASGESIRLAVVGSTVADALVAAGVDPTDALGVEPDLAAPLEPGMEIVVPKTVVRVSQEKVALAFKTVKQSDPNLRRGTREVVVAGAKGSALRIYRTLVTDGIEGERSLVSAKLVLKPVDRVIAVGTRSSAPSHAAKAKLLPRRAAPFTGTSGRRLAVTSTAYAPGSDGVDWRTATGARAGLGVIAVDPSVIPLGTRLYVPGYGYGTAADTGGAIKGARIDLCFETRGDALLWGRRSVSIVVLD